MPSSSPPTSVERAKPWLGTLVSIRVEALDERRAHDAISRAFQEVEQVHQLMSFHQPDSDLSRLNRDAVHGAVEVDGRTYQVLTQALRAARLSKGAFDPTVARELVGVGVMPRPAGAAEPDPTASWRDVELIPDGNEVRFHRPLWLDLGGIAKGYAVDLACERLAKEGVIQGRVDAGGDLRVFGPRAEQVQLRPNRFISHDAPVLEIQDGAVAGSGGSSSPVDATEPSCHVDGVSREVIKSRDFVAVVAERCLSADALTKVVLASSAVAASRVLRREGATAYHRSEAGEWTVLGTSA